MSTSIAYGDRVIDGMLQAAGLMVTTPDVVVKEMSIWLALANACASQGNEAAWIGNQARAQTDLLKMVCERKIRFDAEFRPSTGPTGPNTMSPDISPGIEGVSWENPRN